MKKQSGFTLIELMVVMAIIAILATAGLSAYTGYLKKARDTTRIADLAAINTIVIGAMSTTGMPPATAITLIPLITAANNGQMLKDPLTVGTTLKQSCLGNAAARTADYKYPCSYLYKTCLSGTGYTLATRFESQSNTNLYLTDSAGDNTINGSYENGMGQCPTYSWGMGDGMYEIGTCSGATNSPDYCTNDGALDDVLDNG